VTTHGRRGEPRHFNFCRKTSFFSSEVKRMKLREVMKGRKRE
jgi:hypothetical protein